MLADLFSHSICRIRQGAPCATIAARDGTTPSLARSHASRAQVASTQPHQHQPFVKVVKQAHTTMGLVQHIASSVLLGAMLVCQAWLRARCVSLGHTPIRQGLKAVSLALTALSRMCLVLQPVTHAYCAPTDAV
jgi:hypothetical protein